MTTAPPSADVTDGRGDDTRVAAACAVDSEEQLVAAAIWSRPAYEAAARIVNERAFWRPNHEAIWRAVAYLHTAGDAWDPVLVSDRMRVTQEHVGYIRDVARLADVPWVASNVGYHARLVAWAATKRAAHEAAVRLAQASTWADHDAFRALLGESVDRLAALARAWDGAAL